MIFRNLIIPGWLLEKSYMASNKNQHYVPQCYLRQFAIDGTRAAINLFNIDRKKFIKNAPIKHQCSKNYFYGEDLYLEKAIQPFESHYSLITKQILKNGYSLTDKHKAFLRQFWILQYMRTEAASRRSVGMSEEMSETIGDIPSEYRMGLEQAVQHSMYVFAKEMDVVDDLKVCLIRNKTEIDFVTSDDPAILTNKWSLIDKKAKCMSFGLGSAGNQILLPLTPKVLLLGYDKHVYSVSQKNGWIDIKNKKDIEALNEHQYLNCRANIFVNDPTSSEYVQTFFNSVKNNRLEVRHKINYAIPDKSIDGYKRYVVVDRNEVEDHQEALIHCQTYNPKPSKWPKQIRWRINSFAYSNGSGAGFIRQKKALAMPDRGFKKIKIRK